MVLDNIFYVRYAAGSGGECGKMGLATIFGYFVNDRKRFGISWSSIPTKVLSVEAS